MPEDIDYEKAKEIFEKENLFLVPENIIKETLTVIMYKKGIGYAIEVWEIISNSDVFEIVNEDHKKLINFYLSLSKKISFFNACVICLFFRLYQTLISCLSSLQVLHYLLKKNKL